LTAPASTRWLQLALAAALLYRFWLAAVAPVTADEAYFILWGRAPAIGYYDHPPLIGWLLAPLAAFTDSAWVLRLPAVLVPPLAALMVRAALPGWFGRDRETADLAALAALLAPASAWSVLITTDAPLALFSLASLLVFARAAQRDSGRLFLASGFLLGLAFLSKYLAVLLGLAYLLWSISLKRFRPAALVVLGALPAGLLNLFWNYEACWCNVMFNAVNRHGGEDGGWSLATPALYAASLAYLAAPLLWFAWRGRARLREAWRRPAERALLLAWLLPLAAFAAMSPVRRIGLHWLFAFLPALVLSAALALERGALLWSARCFAALAVLQVTAILVAAALPADAWQSSRFYSRLAFPGRVAELAAAIAPERAGRALATDSYASAALLEYHWREPVAVFGRGTSHARQDDIDTDWRRLAGRDLLILRRDPPLPQDYAPYFREIRIHRYALGGRDFHAVSGLGFDYEAYRAGELADIRARYYRIPAVLPAGRCYFFERYFAG
jgi:4-amino-4-deoxy-L-arabinose transferase-like glycosyltransferase